MEKISICLIILLFSIAKLSSQDYFEGIITYKVKSILKYEEHAFNKYYSLKYGDSVKVYFSSDGSFKREYYGTEDLGNDWMVYDRKSNNFYSKSHFKDTIFYYNTTNNVVKLVSLKKVKPKKIMDVKCKAIEVQVYSETGNETMTSTFYYSGKEKISPNAYADFKDTFWNLVYEKAKSQMLGWSIEIEFIKAEFEAIRIEQTPISKDTFVLPSGIPLVNTDS